MPEAILHVLAEASQPTSPLGGMVIGLLGAGLVLIALGIGFLIRKALAVIVNVVMVVGGAVLLLAALFGGPLGLYEWILGPTDKAESSGQPEDVQPESLEAVQPREHTGLPGVPRVKIGLEMGGHEVEVPIELQDVQQLRSLQEGSEQAADWNPQEDSVEHVEESPEPW